MSATPPTSNTISLALLAFGWWSLRRTAADQAGGRLSRAATIQLEARMDAAERVGQAWTAARFLATDQSDFGPAWRYELIDGRIVGQAAPTPEHGAIVSGLAAALAIRLRGNTDRCRPEAGSGAAPRQQQRSTARIPDVIVRCGNRPRVVFEIVSPSELRAWRARDRQRRELQDVDGVQEVVEIYQDEMAAHIYRRQADATWRFVAVDGTEAILDLPSIGLEIPMTEIYEYALPGLSEDDAVPDAQ